MELAYTTSSHLPGDSYKIGKRVYAVADGVTRIGRNKEGYYDLNDNLVKIPASVFCKEAVSFIEKTKTVNKASLFKAFEKANQKIALKNKEMGFVKDKINYLDKDYLTTTAALVFVKDNKLYSARICDCDITILRKGNIIFQTPFYWKTRDEYSKNLDKFPEQPPQNPILERGWMHKYLRNKVNIIDSYGVLTGEKEALKFIDFYENKLEKGDIIILSTDGFRHYFSLKEFLEILQNWKNNKETIKNIDKLCKIMELKDRKFASERTLIAIKIK